MTTPANHSCVYVRVRLILWLCTLTSAILLSWVTPSGFAKAQSTQGIGGYADGPSSVHGTVLNRITHEPIGRALVYSPDEQYATLTDDRGHFEFKFPPQGAEPEENLTATPDADALGTRLLRLAGNDRHTMFLARKPGFLQSESNPSPGHATPNQSEITIYLDPESLIIGHVSLPGSEGDLRIYLELYRREISEGQEHWVSAGTFTTWADGEFRFCDLTPGTYKLVTHEQLDRDPFTFTPGGRLFGYPPIFYPGTSDFSAASPIQLAAGTTFQANISLTRREYYSVKIPVANAAVGQPMNIRIYPLGHPGPGYSLGYNPAEQSIQGLLPDGNYTLQADTQGQPGSTGILNFSVHGAPLDGSAVTLLPIASLTVHVKEELKSGQSVFQEGPADPAEGATNAGQLRRIDVQVKVTPIEEFDSAEGRVSQPVDGAQEHALVIQNVRPGRYRLRVESGIGYAAAILSGGTDLLQQPLAVGIGGSSSPIEVTIRDDGAQVTGTIKETTNTDRRPDQSEDVRPQCYVYFLPVGGSAGQFRQTMSGPEGAFTQEQLPPGTYRVFAFDREQKELEYANEEALRKFESKGQLIHVTAGQKEHLLLTVIRGATRNDLHPASLLDGFCHVRIGAGEAQRCRWKAESKPCVARKSSRRPNF